MRRRHEQTRRGVLGISRRRRRKSENKSQEMFQPACLPATATNISAFAPYPACPRDEQKSRHPVLERRSTQVEETHYRDLKGRCAQNVDLHPHAFRSARRASRVRARIVRVRLLRDLDPALELSPGLQIALDGYERSRRCGR